MIAKNPKSFYPAIIFIILFLSIACFLLCVSTALAETITASEAKYHIGEFQRVQGVIVSTFYATNTKGEPTFLNMDKPYPNNIFTVLIWGEDRKNFPHPPEIYYNNKKVIVEGVISQYKGVPQIILKAPSQIKIIQ